MSRQLIFNSDLLKVDGRTDKMTMPLIPGFVFEDSYNRFSVACRKLTCYYSWNNISGTDFNNNAFSYTLDAGSTWKPVSIQAGNFGVNELSDYIHTTLVANGDGIDDETFYISFRLDYSLKVVILTLHSTGSTLGVPNVQVDFTQGNFAQMLGFTASIFQSDTVSGNDKEFQSTLKPDLTNGIDSLHLHCDLVRSSVIGNNQKGDVIAVFDTGDAEPGSKFSAIFSPPLYLPIAPVSVDSITLSITDQQNRAIDFNGERVEAVLEIRENPDYWFKKQAQAILNSPSLVANVISGAGLRQ